MDAAIEYLTCAIFEKFILLTDMCSFCWQKCEPRPKLFLRLDIFSTFRSVPTLIFTSYIVIFLHEKPENFYREKRSVALVTGHLLTFLVVLSLFGLVTTQILICENQIIWRLEILLERLWPLCQKSNAMAALFKTKDIKKRARNI